MSMRINGNPYYSQTVYAKRAMEKEMSQKADRADAANAKEPPRADGKAPKKSAEKCTTDTDKVDREIKKLKEKKQMLTRQIQTCGDAKKIQELKKELAQVENELSQKDNETYRRQNAAVTG